MIKIINRITIALFALCICLSVSKAAFSADVDNMVNGFNKLMKGSDMMMKDKHMMMEGHSMMKATKMMTADKDMMMDRKKMMKE